MKSSFSLAKVWFAFSLAALVFAYGVGVGKWEWFPHSFLAQATDQARAVFSGKANNLVADRTYEREGINVADSTQVQPGLTLIASNFWKRNGRWGPGLKLIDSRGSILHEWPVNRSELFPDSLNLRANPEKDLHGSYLFPNGDILVNVEYSGTARIDACGDVKWGLPAGNHHSIARSEDGHFWIPGASHDRRKRTDLYPDGFPGLSRSVWLDTILRVTEDGTVEDTINVLDVLYKNGGTRRYVSKPWQPGGAPSADITHLNDVEPLDSSISGQYPLFDTGDLLVSLRKPHLVFVFDPSTLNVKWHASEPFIGQHDPDFTGDGWIGVFDNNMDFTKRGTMLGGSRIVMLQPHTDSMKIPFPTARSDPFYTATKGKWQYLENGNMLLSEVNSGRVVEVDSADGSTIWEWIEKPYNDTEVGQVTKATRVDLTREDVASWSCSSVDSVSTAQNQQTAP